MLFSNALIIAECRLNVSELLLRIRLEICDGIFISFWLSLVASFKFIVKKRKRKRKKKGKTTLVFLFLATVSVMLYSLAAVLFQFLSAHMVIFIHAHAKLSSISRLQSSRLRFYQIRQA